MKKETDIPVVVDLDGTLIKTDSMVEACEWMWKHKPLSMVWLLIFKCIASRARFKWEIYSEVIHGAGESFFDRDWWNLPLVEWLLERKREGRKIILASAAPVFWAQILQDKANARWPGLFTEAIGSTPVENRRAKKKARYLVSQFGKNGFDYVGNSQADIHVWKESRLKYNVNPSKKLLEEAKRQNFELINIAENKQAAIMEAWDDLQRTSRGVFFSACAGASTGIFIWGICARFVLWKFI